MNANGEITEAWVSWVGRILRKTPRFGGFNGVNEIAFRLAIFWTEAFQAQAS
jgi:hypothetical protein